MRTRTSRRAAKAGIAALVSFSLVAAACGGSDDDGSSGETPSTEADGESEPEPEPEPDGEPEPEPEPEPADTTGIEEGEIDTGDVVDEPEDTGPVPGGTLRIGLEADVDGINPTTSALSAPGLYMSNVMFDNLTAFAADGSGAVPYLAESVTPNEDFTQWQVKLREGISFHDGTPVNAEAIIVNFETQKNDPLVGLAVRPFFPEEGATEVIDDLTVQFNLLEPNVYFPGTLAAQLGYLASPTWLAAALEDPTLNQAPVGTGPFKFDSRSQDSVTRFVRNDDWWGGEVFLDAIEFVPVTDPDTRVDLLFEGDLNSLHTSNPASVADLRDEESVQNIIDETGEESFAMINSAVAPFDDIRARQALTFATPLENYRQLIGLGVARPADQRFIPESQYYNPDVVQEGDDPDRAVELATEYCGDFPENCTDGKINIELQWSGPAVIQTRIAELLTEGWNAAFNVTFDELPQDEHIQQTALGQYNVNTWRQFGAEDPALDNVWLLCRTVGGISLNWPKFCDEERDALLLQAQATEDQAERQELYKQISQKIHDDYLYIFFLHTIWDMAFAENVRGICDRMSPEGVLLTCTTNGRAWPTAAYLAG